MALKFSISRRQVGFLDPFNNFAPKTLMVETRRDPLSGGVARILQFRARDLGPIDHSLYLERDQPDKCPFCPQNLPRMAARFLPEQVPEGHLTHGQAVCFPNAFPYEAVNAVVVLGEQHYVQPAQFTPELLSDGLTLAQKALRTLAQGMSYASVNWNYMMPAGAGLIHPHFQLAAGRQPTRFQAAFKAKAQAQARQGGDIAADYLEAERLGKERWLGRLGPAGWVVAFAPRALYDVMALVPGGRGLCDLKPAQIKSLALGITRVLGFFQEAGVSSFNLALHTSLEPKAGLPLMLRLVSRIHIPPMGVDEINYFEKLHDEMITFVPPEALAAQLRPHWTSGKK